MIVEPHVVSPLMSDVQVSNLSQLVLHPRLYAINEKMRGIMIRGVNGKDLGEMKVPFSCHTFVCFSDSMFSSL